jgi:eukaryotic-like serine/threonine-protein kinase
VLGPDNPPTLLTMEGLDVICEKEGKYAQAEALDRETLEVERRVLGADHPYTLGAMSNLARIFDAQGKYAEAEALYKRTLETDQRVVGAGKRWRRRATHWVQTTLKRWTYFRI